jgi:hypothetical protein
MAALQSDPAYLSKDGQIALTNVVDARKWHESSSQKAGMTTS